MHGPAAYSGHGDRPPATAAPGRPSRRGRRGLRAAGRGGPDARQRPFQPGRGGHRGAGLPRDRAGRGGGRAPVGGRGRAAGRRPPPRTAVHLAAVVAGAVAGPGLRHHEPVAVHLDRPDRPRSGGDAGVPGTADRGSGRLAPCAGPRLRHLRRRGGRRPGPPPADHRLCRHRPGPGGRRLLGLLHPAQPGDRPPPARRRGVGRRRRPVGPGLRPGRDLHPWPTTRRRLAPSAARPRPASSPRPSRSWPTCSACAGSRPASSGSS